MLMVLGDVFIKLLSYFLGIWKSLNFRELHRSIIDTFFGSVPRHMRYHLRFLLLSSTTRGCWSHSMNSLYSMMPFLFLSAWPTGTDGRMHKQCSSNLLTAETIETNDLQNSRAKTLKHDTW